MDRWQPANERELCETVLCMHLDQMAARLRRIPPEHWDVGPALPAPSPRVLGTHALQWLICDRQHIAEADASLHPRVPDAPADQQALCDALASETENWRAMLRSLTPEQMDEERRQFNGFPMNVRTFIAHMIQNCIYKNGQLATIYFALGLDGDGPYEAPFPNPIYEHVFGPAAPNTA